MGAGLAAVQWLIVAALVAALVGVAVAPRAQAAPEASAEANWWRCENCQNRWQSRGAGRVSAVGLRLRRRGRQRARAGAKPAPEWARARGNRRCPHCLSRDVRPSSQQ